jgi:hypothetical protein
VLVSTESSGQSRHNSVFGPLAREQVANTCAPRRIGVLASAGLRAWLGGDD